MSKPLVSVLIPVKNGAAYLEEALRSVVEQSYRPLEVIVVDGNSTDRSREIAHSFEGEGVRCIQQADTGLALAWNQGLGASGGELIAFLDSDDHWVPGKLESQVDLLNGRPEIAGVVGRVRFFLDEGSDGPPGMRPEVLSGEHPGPMPGALLVRREVFEQVGLFDPEYHIWPDVDWFARVKDAGLRFETMQQLLIEKRFHDDNLSHSQPARYRRELVRVLRASAARQRARTSPTRPG
jgi:glycosyltransferase involved in cell wall biosynthesis